jgi:hypothetical protein
MCQRSCRSSAWHAPTGPPRPRAHSLASSRSAPSRVTPAPG